MLRIILRSAISILLFAGAFAAAPPAVAENDTQSANSAQSSGQAPPGMRWIPGGEFLMGNNNPYSLPNERPEHRVKLEGFWMDENAVTNAGFRAFVEATGYKTIAERAVDWEELKKQVPPGTPKPPDEILQPGSLVFTPPEIPPPDLSDMSRWWTWTVGANWRHPQGPNSNIDGKDNYPVVQIAWDDAQAYAAWAGKRLPTEAEWEYAAWGGNSGARYYWGDALQVEGKFMANTFDGEFPNRNAGADGYVRSSPVKSFPPNGYGLYDMAGNVWQWTADLYRADAHELSLDAAKSSPQGVCHNPTGPSTTFNPAHPVPTNPERVIKGGSFLCNPRYCESYRPSARRGTPPDTGSEHVGFRCVKSR